MADVIDLERMRNFGAWENAQSIIKIIETLPFRWDGDKQSITIDKRELIELIKKEIKNG